ncbi:MAG: MBL fold metallo-hydrolase [Planctomycetes bacterium]|nr:MBL fold metallo-hydrolase [Planctomycetota bacterium]
MARRSVRLVLALLGVLFAGTGLRAGDLEVHFLDVGHGDCCVIRTPQGKTILVDCGLSLMGWKVRRYLERQGIRRIELLVVTHPHPDHHGGARGVVDAFDVRELVEPGIPSSSRSFTNLIRRLGERKVRHTIARRGAVFTADDVVLEVLAPPDPLLTRGVRSPANANSLVIRLRSGEFRVLLAGDIEAETEAFLLRAEEDLRADILKIPHHGVSTSSTPAFLDAVRPRYAFIPCAFYAEPSRELHDRLHRRGITWFRADANGTVVFRLAGETLTVTAEHGRENSRLKVAPDWFKLLQQTRAVPKKAVGRIQQHVRTKVVALSQVLRQKAAGSWKEDLRRKAVKVGSTLRQKAGQIAERWREAVRSRLPRRTSSENTRA